MRKTMKSLAVVLALVFVATFAMAACQHKCQHECPTCGKKTEVYSRITGYYRPVQNWNDGKTQEFKDRKVYDVNKYNSPKKHVKVTEEGEVKCCGEDIPVLFATTTCPNCKMVKMMLDKAGIPYKVILAEENRDAFISNDIRQAPTLIVPNGDKLENASNIKKYIEEQR